MNPEGYYRVRYCRRITRYGQAPARCAVTLWAASPKAAIDALKSAGVVCPDHIGDVTASAADHVDTLLAREAGGVFPRGALQT